MESDILALPLAPDLQNPFKPHRFKQVFSGIFFDSLIVKHCNSEGFLVTDNLFQLLILAMNFQKDSSQDTLKAMAEL